MKYLFASFFIVNIAHVTCLRPSRKSGPRTYSSSSGGDRGSNDALIRMLRHAINVLTDGKELLEDILRNPESLMRPEVIVKPSQCHADRRPFGNRGDDDYPDDRGRDHGSSRPPRDLGPSRTPRDREAPRSPRDSDSSWRPRDREPPRHPRENGPSRPSKPRREPMEAARINLHSNKKQDDILRDLDVLPSMDIQANTVPLRNRESGRGSPSDAFLNRVSPRRYSFPPRRM